MIKLTVEIKDDKFLYEYDVGGSRQSSTCVLTPDTLASFTDLLRICSNAWKWDEKQWDKEMLGKLWVEKQAAEAKKKGDSQ